MVELAPHNAYGLALANPVLIAAGCAGYADTRGLQRHAGVGAIVTADIALQSSRAAIPHPAETAAGLVWPVPWRVRSLRRTREQYAAAWAASETPLLLSIVADHTAVATAIEGLPGIAGLELGFADIATAARIVAAVRAVTLLPLLVRVPAACATPDTARALLAAGADAITLVVHAPAALPGATGVLMGPATFATLYAAVSILAPALDAPLIAAGGIATTADARSLLAAGASAVQIGSALLADPGAAVRIATALSPVIP